MRISHALSVAAVFLFTSPFFGQSITVQSSKRTVPSPDVERRPVFQPPTVIGVEEMNKCCPNVLLVSATESKAFRTLGAADGKQQELVLSDFSITIKNTSTKAVAVMSFGSRDRDGGERGHTESFAPVPFLPGERVVRFTFARNVEDGPVELKALVFEDGTYEGELRYVQGVLPILDGARSVHFVEIHELRELARSSDADLLLRLIKAETRIWKSHDIVFAEFEKKGADRAIAGAKCGVYKQYLDIVINAWKAGSQVRPDLARIILLRAADSMELRFSPAK